MHQSNGCNFGSFRDPNGFIFTDGDAIYRQVNRPYRDHYRMLMSSGLYDTLTNKRLLIPHRETALTGPVPELCFKVIEPDALPFISYPYEWCFSQLRDAALLTLEVQQCALDFGMSLKDASAYNVQFRGSRPVFIDTLSFEPYQEGRPWVAYRQFCQHFLAPLALAARCDMRLTRLLGIHLDGVPLDLAAGLLPFRSRFQMSMLLHIHLHAKAQSHYAGKRGKPTGGHVSRMAFKGLMASLASAVRRLEWRRSGTEWGDYYNATNYSSKATGHKQEIVARFLDIAGGASIWDLGANTGMYSAIAAGKGLRTIAFDIDPGAVEKHYLDLQTRPTENLLPLVLDLANPTPALGWANSERMSLQQRGPADTILALALVHHLAISNNVPLGHVAEYFARLGRALIIEFVPKSDTQVQKLLASREDIFPDYTEAGFEKAFGQQFKIEEHVKITDSDRSLYLMRPKIAIA